MGKARNIISIIWLVVAVGLVASCATEVGGSPATTAPDSASQGQPSTTVPQVEDPLDVGPYLQRPCELVDRSVVSSVGSFEPPEPDVDSKAAKKLTGPSCGWFPANSGPTVGVVIDTVNRDMGTGGIRSVYDGKKAGLIEYAEPREISGYPGYPAVVAGDTDDVKAGQCPLHVGVANDLLVIVTVTNEDNPNQACPAATKVAASVLDTLKKGS